LLKDYVIRILRKLPEEVEHKNMAQMIEDYIPDKKLRHPNIVRNIGSDHAYYLMCYPEISFTKFKFYYNAALTYLGFRYDMSLPLVH